MDMQDTSNVLLLQPALQWIVLYLSLSTQLTISLGYIPRTNITQSKEMYVFFL